MPAVVRSLERHRLLAEMRRRVFDGAQRLAAQQGRLRKLRAAGYNTTVAARLLDTFEDSQLALIARLAAQETKKRS
jgi:hypothetical protein